MAQPGPGRALQFRNNALGQYFSQLNSPLIERVHFPNYTLSEDDVLVKRDQFAENFRSESFGEDGVRWPVAFKNAVWDQPVRCSLGFDLFSRLAESERLGLGEDVGQEHIVVTTQRCECVAKGDKITGYESRSLMDQLIERVLPIRSGFAPINRARVVVHCSSIQ